MLMCVCVRAMCRQTKSIDRRKYVETRDQADAALANLSAFIQYRKSIA
jgi:hypothetical protein